MKNQRAKLSHWKYQKRTILHNGAKIQTYEFGTGKNVILAFPSFPHSGLYYLLLLNNSKYFKNVRFITFDLPGWTGYSDSTAVKSYNSLIEAYTDIAANIVSAYNIQKFSVLGYSFGGALAVNVAYKLKLNVQKLVLVSAIINGSIISHTLTALIVKLSYKLNTTFFIKRFLIYKFNTIKTGLMKSEKIPAEFLEAYNDMVMQIDNKVMLRSIYELFSSDFSSKLKSLDSEKKMIVNSINEPKHFDIQAEYMRDLLEGAASLQMKGTHNDFILNPSSSTLAKIFEFLVI